MASWTTPKQDWTAKSHPVDTDFNRIETNEQYLKERTDSEQDQINAISVDVDNIQSGKTIVPEANHAKHANNADNATRFNGWSISVVAEGSVRIAYGGAYYDVRLGTLTQHHYYLVSVHAGGKFPFTYGLLCNASDVWILRITNNSSTETRTFYYKVLELVL